MVGRGGCAGVTAATLFEDCRRLEKCREKIDALSYSGNLSPHLSALRDQAKAAHEAGRLDEAEKLLGQMASVEIDALLEKAQLIMTAKSKRKSSFAGAVWPTQKRRMPPLPMLV